MNTTLELAVINDISEKNLITYRENLKEKLVNFCFRNGISYIPAEDFRSVYHYIDGDFIQEELDAQFCIAPDAQLFEDDTLRKFEHNPYEVRFVVEDGRILGVVHIIDYNHEFLAVELYRTLFLLENNLRTLLVQHGKTNLDFLNWIQHKAYFSFGEDQKYWQSRVDFYLPDNQLLAQKKSQERNIYFPFQTFSFSELLQFSQDENVIECFDGFKKIRNYIAHSRNITPTSESDNGQLIYEFSTLKNFVIEIRKFLDFKTIIERKLLRTDYILDVY